MSSTARAPSRGSGVTGKGSTPRVSQAKSKKAKEKEVDAAARKRKEAEEAELKRGEAH